MVLVTTYKIRQGNAMPLLCDSSQSSGVIIFLFGSETQEVSSCAKDDDVKLSEDMCLMGGDYFSANYQAYPARLNCNKMIFKSVVTKKPILSARTGNLQQIFTDIDF